MSKCKMCDEGVPLFIDDGFIIYHESKPPKRCKFDTIIKEETHPWINTGRGSGCALCGLGPGALVHNLLYVQPKKGGKTVKAYEYKAVVIEDRGHLTHPPFIAALNKEGVPEGNIECPVCGKYGHAVADGWKQKEEQPMGANKLAVLLEREIVIDGKYCGV